MSGTKPKNIRWIMTLLAFAVAMLCAGVASAQGAPSIDFQISGGGSEPQQVANTVKIVLLIGLLTFIPGILMTMTSFTRVIIVLSFLRQAIGTHQMPPNQVLVGLALFISLFIMTPTLLQIEATAYRPYVDGEIGNLDALKAAAAPLRVFMLKQTRDKDIGLFYQMVESEKPESRDEMPMTILIPAYIMSELKTAFQMGFLLYIPFLVVDMIVASVLMAMGMMMLPPIMIALPFKLLMFIMVDGWYVIVGSLMQSF